MLHALQSEGLVGPGLVACRPDPGNRATPDRRAGAAALLAGALAQAGCSRAQAGAAMGVSRQVVDGMCSGARAVTVGDVLDMLAAGGPAASAAECLLAAMTERRVGSASDLPRAALFLASVAGEVAGMVGATLVWGDERRAAVLRLCAALRAQVGGLEACVRAA